MVKISIFKEKCVVDDLSQTLYVIRRDSGKELFRSCDETDAILRAWSLVKTYGLVLVEPW